MDQFSRLDSGHLFIMGGRENAGLRAVVMVRMWDDGALVIGE